MAVSIYPDPLSRYQIATSSTRPSTPYEGQMIYETDTDSFAVWNTSVWVYVGGKKLAPSKFSGLTTVAHTGTAGSGALTGIVSDFHDTSKFSISGGVITIVQGGRYHVDFHVGFGSSNAGTIRAGRLDSATIGTICNVAPAFTNTAGFGAGAGTFFLNDFTNGDTLTALVRQDTGGNLSVNGLIVITPVLSIT